MTKTKNKILIEFFGLQYVSMSYIKGKTIRTIRIYKDKIPCWQKFCRLKATYKLYLSNKHMYITYLCTFHYKQLKKFLK